jgi:hypothetical protein
MLKAPNIELVAKQRPQPTSARLQFKGRINLPPLAPNVENKETHFAVLVVRTLAQIIIPPCLPQQNTSPISFFLTHTPTHTHTHSLSLSLSLTPQSKAPGILILVVPIEPGILKLSRLLLSSFFLRVAATGGGLEDER